MANGTIPGEFAFVATCCRWPLTADVVADLRRRAQAPCDWGAVLRTAERHRVVGIVHRALHVAAVACPPAVAEILGKASAGIARDNLARTAETLRLQHRLDSAGIPALMLKGIALAQRVYVDTTFKYGRDIDVLVPRAQVLATLQMLEDDGYSFVDFAPTLTAAQRRAYIARGYEIQLRHAGRRMLVELHWQLSENPCLTAGIDPFANARWQPLAGGSVRTLGDDDLFAYLCVHGANHFWFRLKWLADLGALLSAIPPAEWPRLYRHAQAHGAGLCAAHALLLCSHVFGQPLPAGLEDALLRDSGVRRLVDLGMANLLGADPTAAPVRAASRQAAELRWRFLLGRGLRFWLAQCAIAMTAPADVVRWPLPRAFGFVYPVIRLPSWLLRRRRAGRP